MSTRCQIDFIDVWKDDSGKKHTEKRRVYRHSDGYPDGVVPDLKEFIKWLTTGNCPRSFGDVEYTAANFIYWSKKRMAEIFRKSKLDTESAEKLGFGVCASDFHGDIEFYYKVIGNGESIEIQVYEVEGWENQVFKLIETVKVKLGGDVIRQ